ncbi:hypothetical protein GOODEAATRI_004287 [Goodea atripinnis]|uniref:Secreted protein n=1 Tax=Goodea atripinnis TaxID=208336 RepID=A0ABV0MFC9_9TELE
MIWYFLCVTYTASHSLSQYFASKRKMIHWHVFTRFAHLKCSGCVFRVVLLAVLLIKHKAVAMLYDHSAGMIIKRHSLCTHHAHVSPWAWCVHSVLFQGQKGLLWSHLIRAPSSMIPVSPTWLEDFL